MLSFVARALISSSSLSLSQPRPTFAPRLRHSLVLGAALLRRHAHLLEHAVSEYPRTSERKVWRWVGRPSVSCSYSRLVFTLRRLHMSSYYSLLQTQLHELSHSPIATDRTQLFAGFVSRAIPNATSLGYLTPAVRASVYGYVVGVVNLAGEGDPPTQELVRSLALKPSPSICSHSQRR
ncbi:hypothetical protein BJY59DRAFT_688706 [Rhodotorula toruloides]